MHMEQQPQDDRAKGATAQRPPIDPLRRVFVPIERRDSHGDLTFRTSDGEKYYRDEHGVIRHTTVRVNGKLAKKLRRMARKAER
jgi:hypothetical protein